MSSNKKRAAPSAESSAPPAKRVKLPESDEEEPEVRKMKNPPRAPISPEALAQAALAPALKFDEPDFESPASVDIEKYVKAFMEDHVVVIPIFRKIELGVIRERLTYITANAPEFKDNSSLIRSMAALGALGTASSFHHPELRALRSNVACRSLPVLEEIGRQLKHDYVHELMDRLSFRPDTLIPSQKKKADEHSDNAPRGTDQLSDDIAGTIVNLNDEVIHFTCRKGTGIFGSKLAKRIKNQRLKNKKAVAAASGFKKVSHGHDLYSEAELLELQASSPLVKIAIPPGHRCIFLQTILHVVTPPSPSRINPAGTLGQWRLYQGVHWGDLNIPYFGKAYLNQVLEYQSAPLLPSGQEPPLVDKNYFCYWPEDVADFAESLVPELHSANTTKITKRPVPFLNMCVHKGLDRFGEQQAKLYSNADRATRAEAWLKPNPELHPSLVFLGAQYPEWKKSEYQYFVPRPLLAETDCESDSMDE